MARIVNAINVKTEAVVKKGKEIEWRERILCKRKETMKKIE